MEEMTPQYVVIPLPRTEEYVYNWENEDEKPLLTIKGMNYLRDKAQTEITINQYSEEWDDSNFIE